MSLKFTERIMSSLFNPYTNSNSCAFSNMFSFPTRQRQQLSEPSASNYDAGVIVYKYNKKYALKLLC